MFSSISRKRYNAGSWNIVQMNGSKDSNPINDGQGYMSYSSDKTWSMTDLSVMTDLLIG